jgi:hypothetical protein
MLLSSCGICEQEEPEFQRFFSNESFWNQPIPEDAEIDPRSDKWIRMLELEPTGEHFSTVFKKWTIPVYEADENTEYVHVKRHKLMDHEKEVWITVTDHDYFGHGPEFNPVPIPQDARPDLEDDAHFCVVDWNRMLAWDMWGLKELEDGTWESKTGMCYRLDGDGVFDACKLGYVDKESVHFHGPSRAAGVPTIAGLVRYDEVMVGKIEHKLSCATRFAAKMTHVYPASWTDGFVEGGIPEGAVIQLDPDLDLSQFILTKEEIIIAKALQEYGMVIVDIAQGQPIYVEGVWGHPEKSWEGKLSEWDNEKGINSIPFKHYRVLKAENPIHRGDIRTGYDAHRNAWLPGDLQEKLNAINEKYKND